jgi:glycosyltransferase involved in cell wall biosynthesis
VKILHFSALDSQTGAGLAAARIHTALLARGIESRFCVAYPSAGLANAFTPPLSTAGCAMRAARRAFSDRLLAPHARGCDYVLSTGMVGHHIGRIVAAEKPDVVHLHWIAGNAFRLASLAGVSVPVLWRLSDMWPFCGVTHLEPDPARYTHSPEPGWCWLPTSAGLPEHVRSRKQTIYATVPRLTLAVPSRWLLAETRRSALLGDRPIELIPTSCDTRVFALRDRRTCREALGLPADARLVLIGATSMGTRWKGGDLIADAIRRLATDGNADGLRVVSFGSDPVEDSAFAGIPVHRIGRVHDRELMAILYNAADVFVSPSRMENLANTVLEALACGTPAVAFDIGGMPDMIEHEVNGWLAPPFDTEKLAEGIAWALDRSADDAVREAARNKILTSFSVDREIDGYLALYRKMLRSRADNAAQTKAARAI